MAVGWCHRLETDRRTLLWEGGREGSWDRVFERLKRSRGNTGGEILMVHG